MSVSPDLFGAWMTEELTSKSLDAGSSSAQAVWRLDVPSDPQAARSILHAQGEALRQAQMGVEHAARRLNRFLDTWEPAQVAQTKSLDAASPEDTLATTLEGIQSPQEKGLLDPLQAAKDEFDKFVQRVRELISNYARVETTTGGQPIGQTVVGWTGDFKTLWPNEATVEHIRLHRQNVRIALARRLMLMRLIVVVSTGAAKIVIRFATPGAQLLVIPAIWQFIRDVVNEYKRMASGEIEKFRIEN